jgi:hypothetical protein
MKSFGKLILICATGLIFITPTSLWAAKSFNHASPKTTTALLAVSGASLVTGMPPSSVPALAVSNDGSGATWTDIPGLPSAGQVNVVACSGNKTTGYCVVSGVQTQPSHGTFILASNDAGNTFNTITVPNLTASLGTASCVANNCILAGDGLNGPTIVAENGTTGYISTLTGFPTSGSLLSSSCVGSSGGESNSTCVVVGTYNSNPITNSLPVLGVSIDTGANWGIKTISGIPANASLASVSCTGSVGSAICVAVGRDVTAGVPMAILSNDGAASTWSVLSLPALPTNAEFASVSCTGTGATAICAAVGNSAQAIPNTTFLYVSVDGGVTWTQPTITGMPTQAALSEVSCAGSTSNAVCMAIGQDQTTGSTAPPLLVTSTNGGVTWAVVNVPGITLNGYYRSVACTNATNVASAAVCTITGTNYSAGTIQVSTSDSGATWTRRSLPSNPYYLSSTATG